MVVRTSVGREQNRGLIGPTRPALEGQGRRADLAPAGRTAPGSARGGRHNTFLLRAEDVFVDLLTDSGTSALSQEQRAAMELGDEAYAGSRSFFRLEAAVRDAYGYRHLIPAHQGRGAEHLLSRVLVSPGQLVPSNLYFTTSRVHAELAGAVWTDVSIPEASDPESRAPVQGQHRPGRARARARLAAPERVAFVRQEACLNMAGGQPFSIENLRGVRELTAPTACRSSSTRPASPENALFVKEREPGYENRTIASIVREIATCPTAPSSPRRRTTSSRSAGSSP